MKESEVLHPCITDCPQDSCVLSSLRIGLGVSALDVDDLGEDADERHVEMLRGVDNELAKVCLKHAAADFEQAT